MQTKYYDAPVRVVCQCLSRGASPPRCFADRDAVSSVSCKGRGPLKDGQQRALFHASGATPSTLSQPSSPSSLSSVSPSSSSLPASVSSPTSAFAFLRASTITSPQAVFEPAVELAAPPEALLVLCTSLLAAELTGRSEKKRQPDAREHTQAAWPSEVRLEEDETAELPLPGCLRLPPFRLNAPAGDAGKGRGTRETPADGSRDAASACPRADFYTPLGDETDSEEATDGEWLSRVPVKLFAAVEAPEGDSRRCLQSASRVCKRGAWLPDEEDPSEILFFENNCLFERVCVPWPRPSSSLSSCEKQSIAASGPPSGLPPRPVSSSVSSASSSVSSASSASPSFRHSATAHPSLLGSHDAMARLVDALHCHLWPNLKRRAPTKPIAELKKSPAGFSAFRMAPSPSCGVAGLGHAKQASGEKTVEISEPMQCENGEVCRHRLKSGLGDGEARKEAVEEAHEGERGVEEERDQTQSRTGRRSGGNAAEEGHRDREKDGTSSVEVKAASDGKRESERSGFHAEKGVEAASCDVTAAGEAKTGRMGNARKAPGGTSREKESEATDVAHLDSLDAMIKQLRAARVESQNLPFEERRARAEAMALRLASMIGLSEDEDD
ncbi:conserved hypothetical protein [Neospora caninum Liverpool]|uniref:Alpha and gamma adaptin binding protein p34,domain-containing n=1 Tax=Neospora caninum (strain Liverpool) TaxID=572307 RepID=F0VMH8_NEOCL|nr:conserved hypothetical protein [Neospora caninum Liverpool]CBZ54924.1 conserved hypothetical protein [Neospora caninum Liverpool]CEL69646.1 TPA: Alpha and gamma adaptin binding protein p34,domain-containing [Neospora caninum Liverpool]|eukprot:XP_003884952.1 conserved hypothetical protein [Neospora caninum Liverpool]